MTLRYEHDLDFDANPLGEEDFVPFIYRGGEDLGYESDDDNVGVEDLDRIRREIELKTKEFDRVYDAWLDGNTDLSDEEQNILFLDKVRISKQIILKQEQQQRVYSLLLDRYENDEEFYAEQEDIDREIGELDHQRYGSPPQEIYSSSDEDNVSDIDD